MKATHTPGDLVALVMSRLEDRGVDLSNFGEPTANEIASEIPLIAAAPTMHDECRKASAALRELAAANAGSNPDLVAKLHRIAENLYNCTL